MKTKHLIKEGIRPIILVGAVIILFPIFAFMTLENIHRQKTQSINLLLEKSAALIRSFEAGTRSGMMGIHWNDEQLDILLTETAMQPDIAFILVTDKTGRIIADNNLSEVGKSHGEGLQLEKISTSKTLEWRIIQGKNGKNIFEAFRKFSPTLYPSQNRHLRGMHHMQQRFRSDTVSNDKFNSSIIFVGLDMSSVEAAIRSDTWHVIIMGTILLFIGFAGIILLFFTYRYQETKTSLLEIKIFSDTLVDNMSIGLIAIDTKGHIARVNFAAEKMLNLKGRSIEGKSPAGVLPTDFLNLIQTLNNENNDIEKEVNCDINNKGRLFFEVAATRLNNQEGVHVGTLLIFKDLTEIKQLKEAVARGEKLASIGRLAAGVAHEIRNPLSSIKGYATFFKEIFTDDPENKETAVMLIEETDRLNRVVSQMVELTKPISLRCRSTNIRTLINESVRLIEMEANNKHIEINKTLNLDTDHFYLDGDQMKQVLINLFLNAIESMEDGGKISINASKNKMLTISVSDTGPGIKKEEIANIFDPYFTTKSSGTGLGLAIVYNIIEAHKGDITVESNLGEGSTFTFHIPKERNIDK